MNYQERLQNIIIWGLNNSINLKGEFKMLKIIGFAMMILGFAIILYNICKLIHF